MRTVKAEHKAGNGWQKYAEAVLFAIERHSHQKRDDGSPFVAHPIRVAESREIGRMEPI